MILEDVIQQCKKGDKKSQYQLYRYCFDLLMPVCMRYHSNDADAAAALNSCFLKIIEHVSSKKQEIHFDHWAKRIMINLLIDEYRKNKRRKSVQINVDPTVLHEISRGGEVNEAINQLEAEEIIKLIQVLKEPGRTIFNMHALEGYSHDEIAAMLNLSTENSRYHLHAARKKLRTLMIKYTEQTKAVDHG